MSDKIERKLSFVSDYMEGAHPDILQRFMETNLVKSSGYGTDVFSESARQKIRAACSAENADVFFLAGGTQTNSLVIGAVLRPYQGVIAADNGHISTHEAGAIEHGGHKVLTIAGVDGKLHADNVEQYIRAFYDDENHDHMVMPGMVYISQPTEFGTLYSFEELGNLSNVCRKYNIPLYLDGARLAYALACPENDVSLPDLAKLCDAFYIGGTKCGALLGEALVIPKHDFIPHIFTMIKQHGALLAKGWAAGLQFDTLFTDGLYFEIGKNAIQAAAKIRSALISKGYKLAFNSPTNQIFVEFDKERLNELSRKVEMAFWENTDENHTIMRIATSWATTEDYVADLISIL